MNYLAAQIRNGDAKAIRRFIMTTRRSKTREDAAKALGISRPLFFRLRKELLEKGHTLDA